MTMSLSRVPLCWMLLALGGEASMILHNARVWTGDPQAPWAQAVAVEGARILAVGSDQEASRWLPLHLIAVLLLLAVILELFWFHPLLLPSKLPLAALLAWSWLRQRGAPAG